MTVQIKYRWYYTIFLLCVVFSSSHAAALSAQMSIFPAEGLVPLVVMFSDESSGNPVDWQWDFGDGYTGSGAYSMHTYERPGVYSVTLKIIDKEGIRDSILIKDAVVVLPHPFNGDPSLTYPKTRGFFADFTAMRTQGTAPLRVEFVDRSTGDPDTWTWEFGDGGTDVVQHPVHTYISPGLFSVSLTTTKEGSISRKEQKYFITVSPGTGSVAYQSVRNGSQPESDTRTDGTFVPSGGAAKQNTSNESVGSIPIDPSLHDRDLTDPIPLHGFSISRNGFNTPDLLMVQNEPTSIPSGSFFTTTIHGIPDEEIFFWVSVGKDQPNLLNGTVPVISKLQDYLFFDELQGPYHIGDSGVSLNGKSRHIRDLITIDPVYLGTRSYGQIRLNQLGVGEIEWNASDLNSGYYDIQIESVSTNSSFEVSIRKASASLQVL